MTMRSRTMRGHAHKMRRHGLQPIVVMNERDRFPDLITVLILRWL